MSIDPTNDPALRSWVQTANVRGADFPIQNLPFGIFRRAGTREAPRVGVAIGAAILDMAACLAAGLFDEDSEARQAATACAMPTLNELMSRGASARRALRNAISALLAESAAVHRRQIAEHALVLQTDAELFLPAQIGEL